MVKPCIEPLTPRSVGGRLSLVTALVMAISFATSSVSAEEPLLRLKIEGASVEATFGDENSLVEVAASTTTVNGEQQVLLEVSTFDNARQTGTYGLAIAPSTILETGSQTMTLRVDLSSIQWLSVCNPLACPPLGIIDLTFKPDGVTRVMTTGTIHRWFPTLVFHSAGTTDEESAQVSGQLLDAITPVQFIFGKMSQSSTRTISIERR